MNITFIGSGNTAFALAGLCVNRNHKILQVIARNEAEGKKFAELYNCNYINFSTQPDLTTELVIIALSDISLPEALTGLFFNNIPVVHTAGSCSINVLEKISHNMGVLYPLQTLRKEMDFIPDIPFLIEANNEPTLLFLNAFAHTLSNNVAVQNAKQRLRLHTAAVIVNNFTNYLYAVAEKFCIDEKVDFNLLKPLIKETAERIQNHSPLSIQTGPAIRNDITTIDKHLKLLNDHPKLKTLYTRLTDGIMMGN